MAFLKKAKDVKKLRVLFIDRKNDLSSQIAEYYTKQIYPDSYEVYSAGPEHDIVDCDMLSVMYRRGEDLRNMVSKDFQDKSRLPEDAVFDVVVWMDRGLFDEISSQSPWAGKQIVADLGNRSTFTATDDAELAQCISDLADRISVWVKDNMADPEKLLSLVSA